MMDMLKILRKLYDDTGFIHTDATPTNIGMYKGEVVIPDLGPNQPGNYDPDRELDKLRSNRRALGLPDEPLI
jgi:serine/threonine-protein kinase RIO1